MFSSAAIRYVRPIEMRLVRLTDFLPQDIGAGRICSPRNDLGPISACEHRMLFSRSVSFSDEGLSRSVNVILR